MRVRTEDRQEKEDKEMERDEDGGQTERLTARQKDEQKDRHTDGQ